MKTLLPFLLLGVLTTTANVYAESCPVSKSGESSEITDFLGASKSEKALLGSASFHQNVAKIEEALNRRGTALPQSGMITAQFRQALIAFQESEGLSPTGEVTSETLKRLGVSLAQ